MREELTKDHGGRGRHVLRRGGALNYCEGVLECYPYNKAGEDLISNPLSH